MSLSLGQAAFRLAFQLSPIILVDGIATAIPGGMLPIIAITEALNFSIGLLSGGDNLNLDNFFANFIPLPGSTLIDNQIGKYPFANQAVAANAIIAQPRQLSMLMICPARNAFGYAAKLATISALQATLYQHNASGGTYTIATPSFFYTNCIMLRMTDASNAESKQAQNAWRLDFEKPLLTLEDAQQAQNGLMSKITGGTAVQGTGGAVAWSGLSPNVGTPVSSAASTVIPAAKSAAAAGQVPIDGP